MNLPQTTPKIPRIVVGSMTRSGSTWAYNAIRLLAETVYGLDAVNASALNELVRHDDAAIEVTKTHDITANWRPATHVVTCVRDLRDAFASAVSLPLMEVEQYKRNGLTEGVLAGIDLTIVSPSIEWAKVADMTIHYEKMVIQKARTVESLAERLFPGAIIDAERIALELEVLPEVYDEYDCQQAYCHGAGRHRQHIGIGGHIRSIDPLDVRILERHYANWFEQFGYGVHDDR